MNEREAAGGEARGPERARAEEPERPSRRNERENEARQGWRNLAEIPLIINV